MFKSDQPISSHKEDLLHRHPFAQNLGRALLSYQDKNSVVVGLFGAWGSGKSSIINMIFVLLLTSIITKSASLAMI